MKKDSKDAKTKQKKPLLNTSLVMKRFIFFKQSSAYLMLSVYVSLYFVKQF